MRIVRFLYRGEARFGLWQPEQVELLQGDPFGSVNATGIAVSTAKVELLAPVAPSKIVSVGLNYRNHAAELGLQPPTEPMLFLKPPSSLIGPGATITYPAMSNHVDFEGELAVVIGNEARAVSVPAAMDYVFGYTCGNDVTARDLQRRDGQWTRAKSFDTFCPLGPWIETDIDPADTEIQLAVNDEVKQHSNTSDMIFDVAHLVSFISQVMTLNPGDVIMTGTPPGVGPLSPGDAVAIEIAGIGTLTNTVA